jgi:disulfide bond formation protein DsbB
LAAAAASSTDFLLAGVSGARARKDFRRWNLHEKGEVASQVGLAYAFRDRRCFLLPMKKNPTLSLDFRDASVSDAAFLIAAVAAATIAGAWFFQYVIGLVPCPLCLDQRVPYYVAIPAGLILGFFARGPRHSKFSRLLLLVIAAILAYGAALGLYHAGVEWKWWPGPATCSGANLVGGGSLLSQIQGTHVVPCDEAQWRFLGLSLAGYNVLIASSLALFALYIAARGGKK